LYLFVCMFQQLTESCREHVESVIRESSLDYVQDVQLARACKAEVCICTWVSIQTDRRTDRQTDRRTDVQYCLCVQISQLCTSEVEASRHDDLGDQGEVVECLKRNLLSRQQQTRNLNTDCIRVSIYIHVSMYATALSSHLYVLSESAVWCGFIITLWWVLTDIVERNGKICRFTSRRQGSPGPYKSLKVLKFHTFKYKALKSP